MIIILNNDQIILKKRNILVENLKKNKNFLIKKKIIYININKIKHDINVFLKKNLSICLIKENNQKALNVIKHSCAHLLAHAVSLLYKDCSFSTGDINKSEFYYDFFFNQKIKDDNLKLIKNKMRLLLDKKINIHRYEIKIEDALNLFKNNKHKINILKNLKNKIISYYKQDAFIDLCLGPHVINTKFLKYFELLEIFEIPQKCNKKNKTFYRIYGTIWESKKKLNKYLVYKKKRKYLNHKTIGNDLEFFKFSDSAPGAVFWNKNGWKIYTDIIKYIRNIMKSDKFLEVNTPMMLNSTLFDKSGHMSKFKKHIFQYNEENTSILKPMNCPCHVHIFKYFNKKSYKNLPFKISEFGSCFRNELSGSLHGLMRLKNFTQDDGHIFCSESQIFNELKKFIYMLKCVYYKFDFKFFKVILSKKPKNINENKNIWIKAEEILENTIKKLNIKYTISNDGAFYGPKLEFSLKDNIGRVWQCGTIQVDFFTSKKLNAFYTKKNGVFSTPIILHRAILGSIERFMGILIENNHGRLPFWVTPIQIEILYINDACLNYAKNIYNTIKSKYKIRLNINNNRLDYKIKKSILEKIPYILILGDKERKTKTVSVRQFCSQNTKNISLNEFITELKINFSKEIRY